MFANRYFLNLHEGGSTRRVPRAWLELFFMRNFTGWAGFDETLVTGDGELEAGHGVDPGQIQMRFEQWLRGRGMIPAEARLLVELAKGSDR